MRKIIFITALLFTVSLYAQTAIKLNKNNLMSDSGFPKNKPVDVRLLHPDFDKGTEEYLAEHPDGLLQRKLGKPSWTFAKGDPKKWYAADLTTTNYTPYQVASTCRAVGTHCYIFVEDASWTAGKVTQAQVDSIEVAFDSRTPASSTKGIYQTDVDTFGAPPDVDGDPKIIIFILDIKDGYTEGNSFTMGYFFSRDQTDFTGSNHAEIFYLDCNPTDFTSSYYFTQARQTLAHEFQHMIHFAYHRGTEGSPSQTIFLNEGCSLVAELVNGYDFREQSSFAADTPQPLFGWRGTTNDGLKDYSRAARFMLYYYDQFGADFLKKFVQSSYVGVTGVDDALSRLTTTTSRRFADILPDWYIANAIDNTSVDPRYGYTKVTGMAKTTGTTIWNANTASTAFTVPAYGAQIITHKGSLSVNSLISGGDATYGQIKVIRNSSTTSTIGNASFGATSSVDPLTPTYTSAQYIVLNTGVSEYSFQYSASGNNPTTPYEFMYDIDGVTNYSVYMPVGAKHAVVFDAARGCTLSSVKVAMRNGNNPLTMEIYTYTGSKSAPLGTSLLNSTTVTNPGTTAAWITVPLTSYNIKLDQSIIVVFTLPNAVVSGGSANTVLINLKDGVAFSNSLFSEDGTKFVWYADDASTYVNKIRAYSLANGVTGNEETELLPTEFTVSQNYPNPFNPSTKIIFSLPEMAKVTVRIYDMLGREIRTLVNTENSAGTHEVMWNGDNDMGQKVASGIYLYSVSTNKFVQTKKMILLK
jgi:hypothetical protein